MENIFQIGNKITTNNHNIFEILVLMIIELFVKIYLQMILIYLKKLNTLLKSQMLN